MALRPVRLTDVPVDVRMKAAWRACKQESDQAECVRIFAAALSPSNKTYYIAA